MSAYKRTVSSAVSKVKRHGWALCIDGARTASATRPVTVSAAGDFACIVPSPRKALSSSPYARR